MPQKSLVSKIRIFVFILFRKLGLDSTVILVSKLKKLGINFSQLRMLEVFGGIGFYHTRILSDGVKSLEIWEIDQARVKILKKIFPKAAVLKTDSFKKIRSTKKKFDIISVDNPPTVYDGYCEHFELFPYIFRIVDKSAILSLNVVPNTKSLLKSKYPEASNRQHLEKRSMFYNTKKPEIISRKKLIREYKRKIANAGFSTKWYFFQRRLFISVDYLIIKISK